MLRQLQFNNFKSWRRAAIEFGPLTAFFGANSSGKSSILQFLLLLKQTKDSVDRSLALDFGGSETPADLGSFRDAVFNHDEESAVHWSLRWTMPEELRIADPAGKRTTILFEGTDITVQSSVRVRNNVPSTDYLRYQFSDSTFSLERQKEKSGYSLQARSPQTNFRFVRTLGRKWDLPAPTKSYAFPDQARTYFQNSQFLSDFENAYVSEMDSIVHLGPLRDYPKRQYVWSGSSPIDVGRRGERTVDAILAATARGDTINLKYRSPRKPFQELVAWWLKEMGLISSFHVEEIATGSGLYRAVVKRDPESPETPITDVGFGLSQVLPALVLLYYAPPRSIVLLEQPEIHLHPAVQSALADLIINAINVRKIQVIIESHSEHLLQRLLRRIAEGVDSPYQAITPTDVRLYFTEMKKGASSLELLRVNLFGAIENWPRDFFGNSIDDIAAREKAALKRRATA